MTLAVKCETAERTGGHSSYQYPGIGIDWPIVPEPHSCGCYGYWVLTNRQDVLAWLRTQLYVWLALCEVQLAKCQDESDKASATTGRILTEVELLLSADYQKAYADYQKAYADWQKVSADWQKAAADRQKTYAGWQWADDGWRRTHANWEKASADYQKAYADWQKAFADWQKAAADRQKAFADWITDPEFVKWFNELMDEWQIPDAQPAPDVPTKETK